MGGSSSSLPKPSTPIIKKGWLTKKVPHLLLASLLAMNIHVSWSKCSSNAGVIVCRELSLKT
jgi:hypothetical protein